jgi:NodT family efflux transporter outer membrane factor (OMF) lipoprotein
VGAVRRIPAFVLASVSAAALLGCTVGPDFERPEAPAIMRYTEQPLPPETVSAQIQGGDAQRFLDGAEIPGQWWTLFGSPALNELVVMALAGNPDLAAAQASLRQARENYIATAGGLQPQVDLGGGVQREQLLNQGEGFDLFSASVDVAYAVDVFGGLRRELESVGAVEDNTRFELEATYLSLISNVIITAIQQASLRGQIQGQTDIIAAQSQQLDLLNQQFELGAVARGDVLAQQSQLAQTQASLPPLQRELEQTRNRLALLLGRFPADGQIPVIELTDLTLPVDLPVSLPSQLIEQRPDVRASEAALHQATALIGVAEANLLPQLNLSASFSSSSDVLGEFISFQNTVLELAAGVTQPIFRGGTLRAQRRAAIAQFERASAQYRSTVLSAFTDVADVLAALQRDAEALQVQLYAEQTAAQSLEITTERFQAGAIAFLSLLDAQRVYQQARILLVVAQANRYADTVALFTALGGGWWNRMDVPEEYATRP